MSILSWVWSLYSSAPPINTVEGVYWWAQIATLGFIFFTVVTGGITVGSGILASKRQSDRESLLRKGIIEAQRALEEERVTRLELEESLTPRVLTLMSNGGVWNFDDLKRFAGQEAVIEFLPEYEPRRAAFQIKMLLGNSGWRVEKVTPNPELAEFTWDGVTVQNGTPFPGDEIKTPEEAEARINAAQASSTAVEALVKFLLGSKWQAKTFARTKEVPPTVVRVLVGFRPPPSLSTNEPLPQQRTEPRSLKTHLDEVLLQMAVFRNSGIPAEIRCPSQNEEACALAHEILILLQSNGWLVINGSVNRDEQFPRRQTGIMLIHSPEQFAACATLSNAFRTAGLESKYSEGIGSRSNDPMKILVGW